jgi:alpha-L-fucosidase
MAVNSEGIHGSRPWKVFGEGPGTQVKADAAFNEGGRKDLTAADVRYTTKSKTLYAFVMGWPEREAVLRSVTDKVEGVELLGHPGALRFTQDATGLRVTMPSVQPSKHAVTLKIT